MSATTIGIAGSWGTLPVSLTPWVLDVIQSLGYTQMTPVQAATIPLFMKNKDVVVEAVTGSGKTLAFVIPILERLIRRQDKLKRNEIGALVISPTRELATQIHSVFSLFLSSQPNAQPSIAADEMDSSNPKTPEESGSVPKYPPALLLISSDKSSPSQDVERFLSTGADIVIGTPGRMAEFLLGRGASVVSAKELEILVLDEADRLLDLGFQASLNRILTHLPKQRRTGLFSATMTDADALSELIHAGLRNPARVVVKVQSKRTRGALKDALEIVEERRIPANLQNYYLTCHAAEKLVQLTRIVGREVAVHNSSRFIVYFATCACVDYFYRIIPPFLPQSTNLFSLHGHLPSSTRTRSLSAFSSSLSIPSSPSVLLTTDVAARGLDLPDVDVVIQFDPPSDPKAFSHRCGRTARAGKDGRAWVLLVGREREFVDFMSVRKIPLKVQQYIEADGNMTTTEDERPFDPAVSTYLTQIRKTVLTDRALHEKATKAYVSFVRAYSKHEASYIFRLKDLDLIGVATSFGLLRLPKMPELKDRSVDEWEDAKLEWEQYAYIDRAQEAKRRAAIASTDIEKDTANTRVHSAKKSSNSSWSGQTTKKDAKQARKEKKDRKRKWLNSQDQSSANTDIMSKSTPAMKGADEEWDELAREERMAKKVRRGNLSQEDFNKEFDDL